MHELIAWLGFLGQFFAFDQVGPADVNLHHDGAFVRKGDLRISIDPIPYEIGLAQAKAPLAPRSSVSRSCTAPAATSGSE
jgi:multidrug efflux system membrane fusion protein